MRDINIPVNNYDLSASLNTFIYFLVVNSHIEINYDLKRDKSEISQSPSGNN